MTLNRTLNNGVGFIFQKVISPEILGYFLQKFLIVYSFQSGSIQIHTHKPAVISVCSLTMEATKISSCVIDIQGMRCQNCVRNIEKTIGEKLGVTDIQVDLEKKEGIVQYDGELVNPTQISEFVVAMGFASKVKTTDISLGKLHIKCSF